MVTIVLTACPAGLRGHLTRWLAEVSAGVFVGKVNARLRDELWALVIELVKDGKAVMIYSSGDSEQGFDYRVHRHEWEVVDIEGLNVIRRPSTRNAPPMRSGWSKASRIRRARK